MVTSPMPKIKFSLVIESDLSYKMLCDGVFVPDHKIRHITTSRIEYSSDIVKIIIFLQTYSANDSQTDVYMDTACSLLENYLSSGKIDDEKVPKIEFILEQLQLLNKVPTRRRYSAIMIGLCLMWYKASSALYNQILSDGVLTVPSVNYLRRLSNALSVDLEFSESTIAYLKTRFSRLNDREKNISIVMDEVHSNQKVEYVGGTFVGAEEDGITKTLLCVMIKSLGGKYCDMIAMLPTVTLKSAKMKEIFMNVLKGVTDIGFTTCAILVDGNRVNTKFYKNELCDGKIMPYLENPFQPGDKIFPLYDTTHIFKCLYNIFLKRKEFKIPAFKGFEEMNPHFSHLKQLYEMELGKTPKYAYKLKDDNLASKPIERVNVSLADSIFHESTINGLNAYSKKCPEFVSTAAFLTIIRYWWNIVNVGCENTGKMKRDETRNAVSLENSDNCKFLLGFADWLENWEKLSDGSYCLTKDTFLTAIHTSRTLPQLADYLLRERKFKYVLFRHGQSDCIERRFGWWRQLNGANYFANVRQFLEAEKTIRLKSLIKFSNISMSEIKAVFSENGSVQKQIESEANALLENIDFQLKLEQISPEDNAILYYVSGYIARSIKKKEKCSSCCQLLVKDDTVPSINIEKEDDSIILEEKESFLNEINRGGLCNPSDIIYITTIHAQEFFTRIFKNNDLKTNLLRSKNPRAVFVKCFAQLITNCENTETLCQVTCCNGHRFMKNFETAAWKIFNIGAKNYVSEMNSEIHANRKHKWKGEKESSIARKICKLQSGEK